MAHPMNGSVIQGRFPRGAQVPARLSPQEAARLPVQGGQPLAADVRQRMEAAFGQRFDHVRVHPSSAVAQAIRAQAFTHGSHIHFAAGQYDPATPHGRHTLAHELAHVVQQRTGRVRNVSGSGVAVVQDAMLEAEAERMAIQAVQRVDAAPPRRLPPGTAQPLTYNRFNWLLGFMQGYNEQETRINTLRDNLRTKIANTLNDFATNRSWMRPPTVLVQIQQRFNNLDRAAYNEGQYNALENDLTTLDTRLTHLRLGWSNIQWQQRDPMGYITRSVTKGKKGELYYGSTAVHVNDKASLRLFVDRLFKEFTNYGFRYSASALVNGTAFIGTDDQAEDFMENPNSLDRYGSCITLANAFATILQKYGVDAETDYVLPQNQSAIVRVPTFIDPQIKSNIEYNGIKKDGFFVFTSHAAVLVKLLKKYYDPMAKADYYSLWDKIDCKLTPGNGNELKINGTCTHLSIGIKHVSGKEFHLVADPTRRHGGLVTYILTPNS
ncbi:MAG: DUF4157 domain-containing protein [Acidobacteria bacterium]|nr:DUF4157 domain-containing protein [Acidobacteriota bacterium]MBV9475392.1 DUF4157 domain-containing protein [Acidobacteriota bacterium]